MPETETETEPQTEPDPQLRPERVMAEIEAEVRRRRASGEIPAELESQLDQAFERYSPMSARDDLQAALRAVDRASWIDVNVPVASRIAAGSFVKKVLRKAMAWYLNYLAQQVRSLGATGVAVMHSLALRVAALDAKLAELSPPDPVESGDVAGLPSDDVTGLAPELLSRLAGTAGRVLHAECGDGWLVCKLVDAGVDAYGTDPRTSLVDPLLARGMDAWPERTEQHLAAVAPSSLGALVLSGIVERAPLARQRDMVASAARVLREGGAFAVVSIDPTAWDAEHREREADLSAGKPLHASTWSLLMERAGLEKPEVLRSGQAFAVVARKAPAGTPASR